MTNNSVLLNNSNINFKKLFGLEKDSDLSFVDDNIALNGDLNQLINNLKLKNFHGISVIINSIYNKTRIFYRDNDYLVFEKFRRSIMIIKNFFSKLIIKKNYNFINHQFLSLEPISNKQDVVELTYKNGTYRFTVNELINIYKFSLHSISDDFYSNRKMEPPKNPYTNLPFSLKNNVIIYQQISKYFIKKQKMLPVYILSFKESYFHIEKFCLKNFSFLMSKSIKSYIEQSSYRLFLIDFFDMIESDDELVLTYCSKCYHKINLKKIFSHTLHLFFLNSNGIYIFGNYKKEYIITAKANNIYYGKDHSKLHFKNRKKLRLRTFHSRNRISSINSPTFLNSINRSTSNLSDISNEISNEIIVNSTDENININISDTNMQYDILSSDSVNLDMIEQNNSITDRLNSIFQGDAPILYYAHTKEEFINLISSKINCLIFIYNSDNKTDKDLLNSIKKLSTDINFFVVDKKIIEVDKIVYRYILSDRDLDSTSLILFQKNSPTVHIERFQQNIDINTLKLYIDQNYNESRKQQFLPNDTILKGILFNKVLEINDIQYLNIITNTYINNQLVNILVYFYSSKSISRDNLNRDIGSLKIIASEEKDFLIKKNILLAIIDIDKLQYNTIDKEKYTNTNFLEAYDLENRCTNNPCIFLVKSNEIVQKDKVTSSCSFNQYLHDLKLDISQCWPKQELIQNHIKNYLSDLG